MRVTDLTKQHSILRNIANNADKMQNLQEGMASGKRIHRLSDDPIGATQVQDYRTSLSYMDATKRNINSDFVWLDRYEAELAHMADLMKEAKSLVLAQANDSADEATRRLTGKEIQAIIDGMVNSGNSMNGKLFMFSGTQTYTRPLETNPETQTALVGLEPSGGPVVLDGFQADFRGYSTHPYILRVTHPGPLGQARYAVSDDNGETWSKENTLLTSNEMVNPKGQPSDKVTLRMTGPQKNAEGGPWNTRKG
ncbi:MAG: hypothetical protein OEW12_05095 [Deltaproteobacteria bacterium]|nr:hypothetical protein [Deltaproteobacteria bacterium]